MTSHTDHNELRAKWKPYTQPKPGDTYEHHKGGRYTVVGTGFLEESETPCVLYRSDEHPTIWVRSAENFFENVEKNQQLVPRFKPIRETN